MVYFKGKIAIIGVNPYVRPPDEVLEKIFSQAKKSTSPIPIKGVINGTDFYQSLVKYQGDWRLYVNIIMAKAARLPFSKTISEIVGQEATFEIEFNPNPIKYEMPHYLKEALNKTLVAQGNWNKLPPSRQKEILRYFSTLKSDEAKARNLQKVIKVLEGKKQRFMARPWKDGK